MGRVGLWILGSMYSCAVRGLLNVRKDATLSEIASLWKCSSTSCLICLLCVSVRSNPMFFGFSEGDGVWRLLPEQLRLLFLLDHDV